MKPKIEDHIDQVRRMVPDVIAAGGGWLISNTDFGDTGLLTDSEVEELCDCNRDTMSRDDWFDKFYKSASWIEADDLKAALRGKPHITKTAADEFIFDYDAIEKALRRLGATEAEADAATDILDVEGWGGVEYEMPGGHSERHFTEQELLSKLALVRDRANEQGVRL